MEKTVLVELTSKQIKLAEGIVLFALFVSLLAGFGLLCLNCCVRRREPAPVTSVPGADGNFSGSDTRLSRVHSAERES